MPIRTTSHKTFLLAFTVATAFLPSLTARADSVTLQDGKVLTGEITAEDADSLTVRLSDSSSAITLSRRVSKAQVKSIARSQRVGPGYVLIPVIGEIGRDATAASLQAGFDEADKVAPTYIVLDIDSKGGSTRELYYMLDVVADAQRDHQIIAYVHNAYSAATVLAMSCRTIFVAPTGVIGATVPVKLARDGPADVEAKFRSVMEARQRAYVTAAGHDPLLLTGMTEIDSEMYLSTDPAGHALLSTDGPGKRIKSRGTILTLTAAEAAECGLSHTAADLADVGRQLVGGAWHEASRAPWDAAVAAAADRKRVIRQAVEARDRTAATAAALERARPELEANQHRLDELAQRLNANDAAIRDIRARVERDKAAVEDDFQSRTRGAFQNEVLAARDARDARLTQLDRAASAAIANLTADGDDLQTEYGRLRARQKALLASVSPD